MTATREKGRLLKSGTESERCPSSTLAREEEQKSKDCLTAAASFSFPSLSPSLADSGAAMPEIFEQNRLLDSAMWRVRWANVICSGVGRKEYFSAGMASAAAIMFLEERARPWRRASLTGVAEDGGAVW